eukprot:gene17697-19465_t
MENSSREKNYAGPRPRPRSFVGGESAEFTYDRHHGGIRPTTKSLGRKEKRPLSLYESLSQEMYGSRQHSASSPRPDDEHGSQKEQGRDFARLNSIEKADEVNKEKDKVRRSVNGDTGQLGLGQRKMSDASPDTDTRKAAKQLYAELSSTPGKSGGEKFNAVTRLRSLFDQSNSAPAPSRSFSVPQRNRLPKSAERTTKPLDSGGDEGIKTRGHEHDIHFHRRPRFESIEAEKKKKLFAPPPPVKLDALLKRESPRSPEEKGEPRFVSRRSSSGEKQNEQPAVEEKSKKPIDTKQLVFDNKEDEDIETTPEYKLPSVMARKASFEVEDVIEEDKPVHQPQHQDRYHHQPTKHASLEKDKFTIMHEKRRSLPKKRSSSFEFEGLEDNIEVFGRKTIDINAMLGLDPPREDPVAEASVEEKGVEEDEAKDGKRSSPSGKDEELEDHGNLEAAPHSDAGHGVNCEEDEQHPGEDERNVPSAILEDDKHMLHGKFEEEEDDNEKKDSESEEESTSSDDSESEPEAKTIEIQNGDIDEVVLETSTFEKEDIEKDSGGVKYAEEEQEKATTDELDEAEHVFVDEPKKKMDCNDYCCTDQGGNEELLKEADVSLEEAGSVHKEIVEDEEDIAVTIEDKKEIDKRLSALEMLDDSFSSSVQMPCEDKDAGFADSTQSSTEEDVEAKQISIDEECILAEEMQVDETEPDFSMLTDDAENDYDKFGLGYDSFDSVALNIREKESVAQAIADQTITEAIQEIAERQHKEEESFGQSVEDVSFSTPVKQEDHHEIGDADLELKIELAKALLDSEEGVVEHSNELEIDKDEMFDYDGNEFDHKEGEIDDREAEDYVVEVHVEVNEADDEEKQVEDEVAQVYVKEDEAVDDEEEVVDSEEKADFNEANVDDREDEVVDKEGEVEVEIAEENEAGLDNEEEDNENEANLKEEDVDDKGDEFVDKENELKDEIAEAYAHEDEAEVEYKEDIDNQIAELYVKEEENLADDKDDDVRDNENVDEDEVYDKEDEVGDRYNCVEEDEYVSVDADDSYEQRDSLHDTVELDDEEYDSDDSGQGLVTSWSLPREYVGPDLNADGTPVDDNERHYEDAADNDDYDNVNTTENDPTYENADISTRHESDQSHDHDEVDDDFYVIDLPPAPAHSCLSGKKPAVDDEKESRKVSFMHDAVTDVIYTYSPDEYNRGSDATIDTVTASAVWELEKRAEKQDIFSVDLDKSTGGLGLSIVGLGVSTESGEEKLAIFVKSLTPDGAAARDRRIQMNDQILEVNGISLVGVTQEFAARTLKRTSGTVRFLMGRDKDKIHYQAPTSHPHPDLQELEIKHNAEMADLINGRNKAEQRAEIAEENLNEVRDALVEAEERLHTVESELGESRDEINLMKQSPYVSTKKTMKEIKKPKQQSPKQAERIDELEKLASELANKVELSESTLNETRKEHETVVEDLRAQLAESERNCVESKDQNDHLDLMLQKNAARLSEAEQSCALAEKKNFDSMTQNQQLRQEIDELKAEVEKMKDAVAEAHDESNNVCCEHVKLIDNLEEEIKNLKEELELKNRISEAVVAERDSFKTLVNNLERAQENLQEAGEKMQIENAVKQMSYENKINDLEETIRRLKHGDAEGSLPHKKLFPEIERPVETELVVEVEKELALQSTPYALPPRDYDLVSPTKESFEKEVRIEKVLEIEAIEKPPEMEVTEKDATEVEAPKIEAQEVDVPLIRATEVDAPEMKAPNMETPKIEARDVEVPLIGAPEVEAQEVEVQEMKAPNVEVPKIESRDVEVPLIGAPEVEAQEVEAQEMKAPDMEAPKIEARDVEVPLIEAPEVEAQEIKAPDMEAPKIEAPEVEAQETEAPDVEAFEKGVIESNDEIIVESQLAIQECSPDFSFVEDDITVPKIDNNNFESIIPETGMGTNSIVVNPIQKPPRTYSDPSVKTSRTSLPRQDKVIEEESKQEIIVDKELDKDQSSILNAVDELEKEDSRPKQLVEIRRSNTFEVVIKRDIEEEITPSETKKTLPSEDSFFKDLPESSVDSPEDSDNDTLDALKAKERNTNSDSSTDQVTSINLTNGISAPDTDTEITVSSPGKPEMGKPDSLDQPELSDAEDGGSEKTNPDRSSFLEALTQNPSFGSWLNGELTIIEQDRKDEQAEEIASKVADEKTRRFSSSSSSSSSLSSYDEVHKSHSTAHDSCEEDKLNTSVQLDESYLKATTPGEQPDTTDSPLLRLESTAVDHDVEEDVKHDAEEDVKHDVEEDVKHDAEDVKQDPEQVVEDTVTETAPATRPLSIDFDEVVPATQVLESSAQHDKRKLASAIPRKSPRKSSNQQLKGYEITRDEPSASSLQQPPQVSASHENLAGRKDGGEKEKRRTIFSFLPKFGGKKKHRRSMENLLAPEEQANSARHREDSPARSDKDAEEGVVPFHMKHAAVGSQPLDVHVKVNGDADSPTMGSSGEHSSASSTVIAASAENLHESVNGEDNLVRLSREHQQNWVNRPVNEWDVRQVGLWLIRMDLEVYSQTFQERNIDGRELLHLNGARLKDLGVVHGDDRALIKRKIKEFKLNLEKDHKSKKDAKSKEKTSKKIFWKG